MLSCIRARKPTPSVRRCLLDSVLVLVAEMGTATAAAELGCDETTVRRRRDRERADDWTLADVAVLLAWERDQTGSRRLLDAIAEADGRDRTTGQAVAVETSTRALLRSLAEEVAHIMGRLEDDGRISRDEAAATIPELEDLARKIDRALGDLRAKATP